jgi:hypothetical protein
MEGSPMSNEASSCIREEILKPPAIHHTGLLWCWTILAVAALAIDYLTGPLIRFPIMYLLPVVLASWYNGRYWGLVFAVGMPLVHLTYRKFWITPFGFTDVAVNAAIQIAVFSAFGCLVHKVAVQKRALEQEIRTLQGILPICSFCKRIRNLDGEWESLEGYITKRSEAEFSHGICAQCAKTHYPDLFKA